MRILLLGVVGALFAAACSFQEVNEGSGSGGGTSTASSTVSGGGAAGPGTGGTTAAATSSATGIQNTETAGKVACGDKTCTVPDEVCCGGACVDAATGCEPFVGNGPHYVLHCDDSADCDNGEICCAGNQDSVVQYDCAASCVTAESCIPGGLCSAPNTCVDDATSPSGARCVPPGATAPDCGASPCAAPLAVCCSANDVASCTDTTDACATAGGAVVYCDSGASCAAPYAVCCLDGVGATTCQAACAADQAAVP